VNRVVNHHFVTYFIGKAKSEDLKRELVKAIDEANLSLKNLLMIGSDRPFVDKKVWHLINSEIV